MPTPTKCNNNFIKKLDNINYDSVEKMFNALSEKPLFPELYINIFRFISHNRWGSIDSNKDLFQHTATLFENVRYDDLDNYMYNIERVARRYISKFIFEKILPVINNRCKIIETQDIEQSWIFICDYCKPFTYNYEQMMVLVDPQWEYYIHEIMGFPYKRLPNMECEYLMPRCYPLFDMEYLLTINKIDFYEYSYNDDCLLFNKKLFKNIVIKPRGDSFKFVPYMKDKNKGCIIFDFDYNIDINENIEIFKVVRDR